jgi:nucleotide-binding universal stress UspA family protein
VLRHLLVPLDGSPLAEAVLPVATAMAARFQARVTLFHILEKGAPDTIHGQPHLTDGDAAQAYLEGMARRPGFTDLVVDVHVHRAQADDVAVSVVQHAEELGADLIVLATHGRGGLRRLLFGRVAQRALQRGATPVLLVTPTAEGPVPSFTCRSILVPLDGASDHEPSVSVAAEVAQGFQASVSLLAVVPTPATLSGSAAATASFLPLATREVLDLAERQAATYVERIADSLTAKRVGAAGYISRGDPARALIDAAQVLQADLVVMATHGKATTEAFWSGSLTPRIMETLERPLLLVHAARGIDLPATPRPFGTSLA